MVLLQTISFGDRERDRTGFARSVADSHLALLVAHDGNGSEYSADMANRSPRVSTGAMWDLMATLLCDGKDSLRACLTLDCERSWASTEGTRLMLSISVACRV